MTNPIPNGLSTSTWRTSSLTGVGTLLKSEGNSGVGKTQLPPTGSDSNTTSEVENTLTPPAYVPSTQDIKKAFDAIDWKNASTQEIMKLLLMIQANLKATHNESKLMSLNNQVNKLIGEAESMESAAFYQAVISVVSSVVSCGINAYSLAASGAQLKELKGIEAEVKGPKTAPDLTKTDTKVPDTQPIKTDAPEVKAPDADIKPDGIKAGKEPAKAPEPEIKAKEAEPPAQKVEAEPAEGGAKAPEAEADVKGPKVEPEPSKVQAKPDEAEVKADEIEAEVKADQVEAKSSETSVESKSASNKAPDETTPDPELPEDGLEIPPQLEFTAAQRIQLDKLNARSVRTKAIADISEGVNKAASAALQYVLVDRENYQAKLKAAEATEQAARHQALQSAEQGDDDSIRKLQETIQQALQVQIDAERNIIHNI
jgi:hypothetical protein